MNYRKSKRFSDCHRNVSVILYLHFTCTLITYHVYIITYLQLFLVDFLVTFCFVQA